MSFLDDGVILYAPTPNSRRQNFTLAHELGHWIVERDTGLFDWIADQSDPSALLESVCDQIAQRLLLPDALTRAVVGDERVRAHHVQELFDSSQASYQACAIAIARQIRGLGAVVLIDRFDGQVHHASIQPDPDDGWPQIYPWRGQTLPEAHGLRELTPERHSPGGSPGATRGAGAQSFTPTPSLMIGGSSPCWRAMTSGRWSPATSFSRETSTSARCSTSTAADRIVRSTATPARPADRGSARSARSVDAITLLRPKRPALDATWCCSAICSSVASVRTAANSLAPCSDYIVRS
ncbi:ImmA/IrrE family metallo-endopeptidase [Leifsonia xyli]|uniref:ImmA/IrrE family metallo-endopeptidase n=1 Tax=Leifsonia xyli TaxID=1575 RepID=UPI003D66B729